MGHIRNYICLLPIMAGKMSTSPLSLNRPQPQTFTSASTLTARTPERASGHGAARIARDEFVPAAQSQQRSLLGGIIGRVLDGIDSLFGRDSTGLPGWMQRAGLPPTRDVTSTFRDTYARAKAGESVLPKDAKNYVYLTVDGLTGDEFPGYMEPNRDGLRKQGLDVREIPIETEETTEVNAKQIRDAILEASKGGKQVVLIGHSKGGVDISAAIAKYPELKEHVRAVVAMQSPYAGAVLAQDLRSNPVTRAGVKALAEHFFDGTENSVRDLTYDYRQQFIQEHPYPTDIPTVSLATSEYSPLSLLAGPAAYSRLRYGAPSDGLVVPEDAMIPGSDVVQLNDLDHIEAVMPSLSRWDAGALTVSLVDLALRKPQASTAQKAA